GRRLLSWRHPSPPVPKCVLRSLAGGGPGPSGRPAKDGTTSLLSFQEQPVCDNRKGASPLRADQAPWGCRAGEGPVPTHSSNLQARLVCRGPFAPAARPGTNPATVSYGFQ